MITSSNFPKSGDSEVAATARSRRIELLMRSDFPTDSKMKSFWPPSAVRPRFG